MAKLIIPNTPELNRYQGNTLDSMKWLRYKVRQLKDKTPSERKFDVGRIYCFCYCPITRHEMPYYDKFPLTLVLGNDRNGFLGVNLHYLPPKMRYVFLNKLMPYASNNKNDEVIRFRISYDILKTIPKLKEYKPALKQYLYTQLRSKIVPIPYREWQDILNLPFDRFIKQNRTKVWDDSVRQIKDNNGS
jgi:hypothetical protein